MWGIENYYGFIIAGIILNITPGADTIYIITRSIGQGQKAGIYSVLGIGSGAICHTLFSALGLSMLLMKSAMLFNIIKYAGVIYLFYLGGKMIAEKNSFFVIADIPKQKDSFLKIYKQGFFTNLLNPKVSLFFLSLLPQFIKPEYTSGPLAFLILGFTFIATGTIWCLFLAFSSSYMTKVLRRNNKIGVLTQKLSGCIFILLGIHQIIHGKI